MTIKRMTKKYICILKKNMVEEANPEFRFKKQMKQEIIFQKKKT